MPIWSKLTGPRDKERPAPITPEDRVLAALERRFPEQVQHGFHVMLRKSEVGGEGYYTVATTTDLKPEQWQSLGIPAQDCSSKPLNGFVVEYSVKQKALETALGVTRKQARD